MDMTYTPEAIKDGTVGFHDADLGEQYSSTIVRVADGETAWHPGSTKHVLHGPCVVDYLIHPSGIQGTRHDKSERIYVAHLDGAFQTDVHLIATTNHAAFSKATGLAEDRGVMLRGVECVSQEEVR